MAKCYNCGRETMRTEDWACQWCGHPLLHGPFKKIEKTYKQLKEERLYKSEKEAILEREEELEYEREIKPKQDLEVIKGIKLEQEPETGKEIDVVQVVEQEAGIGEETEPVKEPEGELEKIEESESGQALDLETEKAQEVEAEEEVEAELEEKIGPEYEVVRVPEPDEIGEHKPVAEPEIEKEVELKQEPEPEPEPPDMELNVGEILAAYEEDDVAADEKFMNKILRVTGEVSLIDIKDKLDIHYIRLTGSGGDPWQNLQCIFDKKYSSLLEQLEKYQTVTVQGRYNGSIIAIRMIDCILIS